MKQILLYGFLLFSNYGFGQESIVVEYLYEARLNYEKLDSIRKSEGKQSSFKMESIPVLMKMIVTKNESTSYLVPKLVNQGNQNTISIGDSKNIYYKNYVENYYLDETNSIFGHYIIKDSLKKYDWQITDETKTIKDYKVIKAIAFLKGKKLTAWYAPDLPFEAGPRLINGLPGLILEAYYPLGNATDTYHVFVADKIYSPKKKDVIVKPDINVKIISPQEFDHIKSEKRKQINEELSNKVDRN